VARRKAPLATTRPTIELRYMCAAGTPWREASSGSHVHHPEAASAANQSRHTTSVVHLVRVRFRGWG